MSTVAVHLGHAASMPHLLAPNLQSKLKQYLLRTHYMRCNICPEVWYWPCCQSSVCTLQPISSNRLLLPLVLKRRSHGRALHLTYLHLTYLHLTSLPPYQWQPPVNHWLPLGCHLVYQKIEW